jgi:hypothetical protein
MHLQRTAAPASRCEIQGASRQHTSHTYRTCIISQHPHRQTLRASHAFEVSVFTAS